MCGLELFMSSSVGEPHLYGFPCHWFLDPTLDTLVHWSPTFIMCSSTVGYMVIPPLFRIRMGSCGFCTNQPQWHSSWSKRVGRDRQVREGFWMLRRKRFTKGTVLPLTTLRSFSLALHSFTLLDCMIFDARFPESPRFSAAWKMYSSSINSTSTTVRRQRMMNKLEQYNGA